MAISLIRKLFERYAKRQLTFKVRPKITEEGIMTIPNEQRVKKWADNLYKELKAAGVTDDMIKTENDIKILHRQVAEINNQQIARKFKDLMEESTFFNPEKSADVLDLTGKKIDTSKPILGGKNVPESIDLSKYDDAALNALAEEGNRIKVQLDKLGKSGTNYEQFTKLSARKREIDEILTAAQDVPPSGYDNFKADIAAKKQTESQIKSKLEDMNKKTVERIKRKRYEAAIKAEEAKAAADEDYIMKVFDPEDLAYGGIAGMLGERTGYADGRWGDPGMSPGTRADYSPGQGHRENVGRPPGGGDPGMTYTARPSPIYKDPYPTFPEPIGPKIKKIIEKKLEPYEKKQRDLLSKQQFQWGPFEKYKTLRKDGILHQPKMFKTSFESKNLLDKFFTEISIKYPNIKVTDEFGYVDKNKAKQVIDKAVLDGNLSIGDSFNITRTLDTMGEGITGINLDTKYLNISGLPEANKYTVGSKFNVGDLGLGYTGNIQGDDITKQGLTFNYGDGTLKGEFTKNYDKDSTLGKLNLDKTFDLNDLAKLNIKGDISKRSDQDFTTSSLTPKLNIDYGNVSADISKDIIEGGTPDLGLGFSYPFAGGEFKASAGDILSENPSALLGYSYNQGDPYSTDPYLGFNLNWDPVQGNKSAFFGLKKNFAGGGRTGSGLNYLVGEDDQNVRVPYKTGLKVYPFLAGSKKSENIEDMPLEIDPQKKTIVGGGTLMAEGENYYGGIEGLKIKEKIDYIKDNQTLFKDTTDEDKISFILGKKSDDYDLRLKIDKELENAGLSYGGKYGNIGLQTDTDFENPELSWTWKFAGGGLAPLLGEPTYADDNHRVPYGKGKLVDVARRKFLQLLGAGAATAGAAKSGLFGLLKGGGKKQIIKDLTSVPIKDISGMPAWFKPLVNKVIKEGKEVESGAERVITHKTKLPNSKTDVYVEQDLVSGDVNVQIGTGKHGWSSGQHGQPVSLQYTAPRQYEWGEEAAKIDAFRKPATSSDLGHFKGTQDLSNKKTKPEFWVDEAEFTGGHPENVKFEESTFEKFGEHASDFSEVEEFATGLKKGKGGSGHMASGGRVPLFGGGAAKKLWQEFIEKLFIKSSNEIRQGKGIWQGLTQDQWIKQHHNLTKKLKEWKMGGKKALPPGMKEYFGMNEIQLANKFKIETGQIQASRPTKTLEGIEKTGTIDISNPGIAEEFSRFMKETDPKGFKELEQKIQLESFDPKGKKGHASGGIAGMLGE